MGKIASHPTNFHLKQFVFPSFGLIMEALNVHEEVVSALREQNNLLHKLINYSRNDWLIL